jgi:UDP-N-acetylglucosamine acyltransferase
MGNKSDQPATLTASVAAGDEPAATTIHPTAQIHATASIGAGVKIGPYCIIDANVVIGDNCKLIAHVHLTGRTMIGARTVISPFASLGTSPQSVRYRGGDTRLMVGPDCDIRENVTMNTGTEDGGGLTEVGARGFFMTNSHIGHDCHVGDDVVMAHCAGLSGHCIVGDYTVIGGLSGVHQRTRIGAHAMIGGSSGVREDVIPFGLVAGSFARLRGVNVAGLKGRRFTSEAIRLLRSAYRTIFYGDGTLTERLETVASAYGHDENVTQIVAFIRGRGERRLCLPNRK